MPRAGTSNAGVEARIAKFVHSSAIYATMCRRVIKLAIRLVLACAIIAIALGNPSASRADDAASTDAKPDARQERERLFREQVRPILTVHCRACHNAEKSHGTLNLDSRTKVPGKTESGARVADIPFAKNELWRRVSS